MAGKKRIGFKNRYRHQTGSEAHRGARVPQLAGAPGGVVKAQEPAL
ncbi:protein of unknown function (plasmid) [Cupriavidus taiwanensis]|uniref:Uncharacterized protein n=1 Tax=Cupriavidus taiwanensis TaxID=164546 RepID=A0A9Q7V1C5_9BURK|nr:hypothetical protein [Cupriavidus taiwanensis]SPD67715.1 protein of unknown function [Cupriavidus taiwanensis]